MTTEEKIKETAMVSAIMSDHYMNVVYEKLRWGYIGAVEQIAIWAQEFVSLHEDTDWGEVLANGMVPYIGDMQVVCWDDAVVSYAALKISQLD